MYFCPNCSYIFDIGKSNTNIIQQTDDKIIVNKINDLFKLLDNNSTIDFNKYKADFTKDELYKNKKFQKIKEETKNLINNLFEDNYVSNAEFKCNNCNNSKQITETTLLYQINQDDNNNNNKNYTIEDIKLMALNPLLPHHNDYTCKNIKCKTHKDASIKDAVFYKEKNNYKTNYICTVCYYNW